MSNNKKAKPAAAKAKATPEPKLQKPVPHPLPADRYANFGRKSYAIGDTVFLAAEVNGIAKGTKCTVMNVQFDGAVFIVKTLLGLKHGTNVRIKADDLS